MKKTKLRKKVLPGDLKPRDLDLLQQASYTPETHFLCFGHSYFKLKELELITNENKISYYGKQLVKYMRM